VAFWKYFLLLVILTIARALREIRHYQSEVMDDTFFIPMKRFRAVVQEVAADIKRGAPSHFEGEYRWEGDALICLQTMTEHVLLMVFELWYFLFSMYTDQVKNWLSMQNESW